MLPLGHTGISLGVTFLMQKAFHRDLPDATSEPATRCADENGNKDHNLLGTNIALDYRFLLLGSLLPDIIDKPIGTFLLANIFSNGRIFSHSLLFAVIMTFGGLYFHWKQRKDWFLSLAFGSFIHLLLDQMWLEPKTFLWPAYGWVFPKCDLSHWLENILYALLTDPGVYIPELIGATILISFLLALVYRKRVYTFIKEGQF